MDEYSFISENGNIRQIRDLIAKEKDEQQDVAINETNSKINTLARYSTTETQVGTWIDGKPIYRKTWSFPSFSSTEGIIDSSGTFDKIISQQGYMIVGSQILPIAQNRSSAAVTLRIPNASQHNLAYIRTNDVNSAVITIEYTKTTD